MKKFVKLAAVVLAVGVTAVIAGCESPSLFGGGAGCRGCGKKAVNVALTSSNWFTGTNYRGIQPTFVEGHDSFKKEVVKYSVAFDSSNAGNKHYTVDYKDGSYTTEFYAVEYDWSTVEHENYRVDDTKETVYYFKTTLSLSVNYAMKSGGEESGWLEDSVVTESWFRAAAKNLKPIKSVQTIKSSSPASVQPSKLAEAYTTVDVTYKTYYNYNCTQLTTYTLGENTEPVIKTVSTKKVTHSLFDNSELYVAVRSLALSENLSQTVSMYSAAAGGISNYTVTGDGAALSEEEAEAISAKLETAKLFAPTEEKKTVPAVAVNLRFAGGNLHGTTQTVWYAAVENPDHNTSRATMLKISTPLYFNLGTLNYTLEEVVSTLWNGE